LTGAALSLVLFVLLLAAAADDDVFCFVPYLLIINDNTYCFVLGGVVVILR
jgi:hypothetical protein